MTHPAEGSETGAELMPTFKPNYDAVQDGPFGLGHAIGLAEEADALRKMEVPRMQMDWDEHGRVVNCIPGLRGDMAQRLADARQASPGEPEAVHIFTDTDPAPSFDPVQRPAHYASGRVECIDAIREALGDDAFVAYCRGNAIKYAWRSGKKAEHAEDLRKAAWYLQRGASVLEEGTRDAA